MTVRNSRAYNNKVYTGTKVSPFQMNQGQNPRIGSKLRKKRKYEGATKFVERMRSVQEEAKAALSCRTINFGNISDIQNIIIIINGS